MTGQLERQEAAYKTLLADVKDYLHRQVKSALQAHSDAVRAVSEIVDWVHTQEHLLSLCEEPGCASCRARQYQLDSLTDLLPVSASGEPAGGGEDMAGTRVTRFGGDEAAFGGSDSGNPGDDKEPDRDM